MIAAGVVLVMAPQWLLRWSTRWVELATHGWGRFLSPVITLVLGVFVLLAVPTSR